MTDADPPYRPIDCGQYSRYELAVMHHTALRIAWQADGIDHLEVLTPTDLRTRDAAEYLIATDAAGGERQIRLDLIRSAEPLQPE